VKGAAPSRVRILAGRWKGRALEVPDCARPTSSRAREALFDILQDAVSGARVLDLFAGSGAVGIEALSRGAREAVFVESDADALEKNLARLGALRSEFRILRGKARIVMEALARDGERFDLVFADPPYAMKAALARPVVELLAPGGTIVIQTDGDAEAPRLAGISPAGRRAYGRNVFWFFESGVEALPRDRPEW
jgi:16S rRNA (guanine966-N2)-methyltransferase